MLGKLIGKAVGTVLAAPAIVAKEAEDAVEEVGETVSRAWDRLERDEPAKKKPRGS